MVFFDNIQYKLEGIGKRYNLLRERIRQIEAKAIKKIRKSKHIKSLAGYMENPDKAINTIDEFRNEYSSMPTNNYRNIYIKTM